jgi:hypothetical protein
MKKILYLVLLLTSAYTSKAQFTLTGEIRPRSEFRNGFKSLTTSNADPALFVEQRSRLYFNMKKEKYDFQITLQNVGIWGENPQIYKSDNSMTNIFEAWGSYHLNTNWNIKVGRQALNYDNARFLGDLDWAQQGRSHDLLLFEHNGDFTFHAGAAFNQEDVLSKPEPTRLSSTYYASTGNYKTMQFIWFNKKYEAGQISFLALNNGVQLADSTVNYGQTIGLYSKNKKGNYSFETEAYYQGGKDRGNKNISAYLLALSISKKTGKSVLSIGADYLSGTDANSSKNNSFDPLFGTNHKFYGVMDYFYVGSSHKNVGLTDLYFRGVFTTGKRSKLIADTHYFLSAVDLRDVTGATKKKSLGTEMDLVWNYEIETDVNLKIGYSQLFATSSMELIKNGSRNEINNWAWMMLTFKPELFKSEK